MPSRRTFLAGAAFAAVAVALPALAAPPVDPKTFLTQIYQRITAGKGEAGGQQYWLKPESRARWFSKATAAAWAKAEAKAKAMDDVGPIDFDVFTNSQDPKVKSAAVELLESRETTAKLRVTLTGPGYAGESAAEGVLIFDLVREGDAWKIDDVWGSVAGDPWHLRDLLTQQ